MGTILTALKKRDALVHKTRDCISLSIQEAAFIGMYNQFLKSFGFPERDTHTEPDKYDEVFWRKVAKSKDMGK